MLRVPDDLLNFCESLQIAPVDLPDWYADFHMPPTINNPQFVSGPLLLNPPSTWGKNIKPPTETTITHRAHPKPARVQDTKKPDITECAISW